MTNRNSSTHPIQRAFERVLVLNGETLFYIAILLLAIFTRFYALGDRVMSHDESLHTRFSYNLYHDGDYRHTPLMHGPVLFHAVAFSYYLFGDSDFSARIYPAVLGVLMVLCPLLFRRWLGKWGAMLASLMLLISPLVLYYNRYIREDTPNLFYAMLMMWAILMYMNGPDHLRRRERWLYVLSAAMILCLGSKETAFIYIAIFGVFLAMFWFARLGQHFFNWSSKTAFYTTTMGILSGGVLALGMYTILDMIKFDVFAGADEINFAQLSATDQTMFVQWSLLAVGAVLAVMLGSLLWAYREALEKVRWREVAYVIGWMLLTCFVLVVMEEGSHTAPTSGEPSAPPVPGEAAVQLVESTMRWTPMIGVWLAAAVVIIFMFAVRRRPEPGDEKGKFGRGFWGTMDLFPEVDLMVIIATFILPWATALVPYLMKGTSTDFLNIANGLPEILRNFIDNLPDINTPEQIGQIALSGIAFVPLAAMAVVIGISWNWRKWLIAAAIFHGIFAFFFTSVFTNFSGLGTGMVYSLGYWLEQQGVRRGSQPQYYYLLVIMPFYEFLPIIGSGLAMIAGYVTFWRWRRVMNESEMTTALVARDFALDEDGETVEAVTDGEARVGGAVTPKERDAMFRAAFQAQVQQTPLYYLALATLIIASLLNLVLLGSTSVLKIATSALQVAGAAGALLLIFRLRVQARAEVNTAIAAGETDVAEFKRKTHPTIETGEFTITDILAHQQARRMDELPFLLFWAWLAVLNLVAYSLAGEKMPWLAIHLTFPMIFLTAWFFGRIFSRIDWTQVQSGGWILFISVPLFLITAAQVYGSLLIGHGPFQGLSEIQLKQTYGWLASLVFMLIALVVSYVVIAGWGRIAEFARENTYDDARQEMSQIGLRRATLWTYLSRLFFGTQGAANWKLLRQMFAVSIFGILALVTFRSAWMAAFINYDYPNEFIVYAHAAPAIKWVLDDIEELSLRTTGGYDLRFAYDNSVSWPYSWYFRNYKNAVFVGENPTVQYLENAVVVVVGDDKRSTVEPILEDKYIRFDHMRLWWPMQDYFNLTPSRVINLLDFAPENPGAAQIREGIFDIWWSRDYTKYGTATTKDYSMTHWPVSDTMHVYIRKDVAKQVWNYGTGDGTVFAEEVEPVNQCNLNWQTDKTAVAAWQSNPPLSRPLGIAMDDQGNLYVAEEFGHRITVFDKNGLVVRTIGQQGSGPGMALFNRPNSVAVAPDGTLLIADTWNYRIQQLDTDDTVLAQWGKQQESGFTAEMMPTDGFWGPRDVRVDQDGYVYVSDTGNKRVRVYSIVDGSAVYQFDMGSGGSAPGQLDEPNAIAIHPDGRVFIADTWNRRISVFNREGAFLTTFPVKAWYERNGNLPYLALDTDRDLLYVGDPDGGRVLVYTSGGDCVGAFGSKATEANSMARFDTVAGIAVDAEGNVYVADSAANRILKFAPFELPVLPEATIEVGAGEGENGAVVLENAGENANAETTQEATEEAASQTEEAG